MNRKRIVFIIFLIFIAITIFFLVNKKNVEENNPIINKPLPSISGTTNVKTNYLFNLPQDLSLPETASYITQDASWVWRDSDIDKIASVLMFAKEPVTLHDTILGKTYFFTYIVAEPMSERIILTTKELANTIQVNLSPVNGDVKIITRSPNFSLATV